MENDVLTRLLVLPASNWEEFAKLIYATTGPREVHNWARAKHRAGRSANIQIARKGIRITDVNTYKALDMVDQIRHLAKRCDPSATVDAKPYLWGLFLNAIFRLMIWWEDYQEMEPDCPPNLAEIEQAQWKIRKHKLEHGIQRCLIFAGILCCRLKNWGTPEEQWPPQEWIDVFRAESESGSPESLKPTPTLHLQLTDQRNSQQEFVVRVLDLPNQQPHATSRLPYGPDALTAIVKLLQLGRYTPDEFDVVQVAALQQLALLNGDTLCENWMGRIGSYLFDALLPPDNGVRSAFENSFYLDRRGGNLILSFDEDAAALACYPWEMLHDGYPPNPRTSVEPANPRTPVEVVRYVASARTAQRLEVPHHEKPCSLLYVSARPKTLASLQSDQDAVQKHLAAMAPTNQFRFEKLDGSTHQTLKKRLLDSYNPVHVLHFDGHGTFARHCSHCDKYWYPHYQQCTTCHRSLAGPRGYLAFETDAEEIGYTNTEDLLEGILRSQIRLVVLSSCESARVRGADLLLAGVGPGLILGGVPAVVAMQFPILDRDAVRFFDEFYSALAQGKSLPNAVSRGRSKLDGPARWAPVLYLRSRGDQIHLCGRK